jgi:hypothetical protein
MKLRILSAHTRCFSCEALINVDDDGIACDAGFAEISFHYGSKLDQCKGFDGQKKTETALDKMLACDKIEAYICDECFRRKYYLCQGYKEQ